MQGQLSLDGIPEQLLRVTPARLGAWRQCPRKYRMAYVDRPTPSRAGPWASSTVGAVVHNALRALFLTPVRERTPDTAARLVDRYWKDAGFADRAQATDYRQRARTWVRRYVADLDSRTSVVAVERSVSAATGALLAEGRVDRIDQRAEDAPPDAEPEQHEQHRAASHRGGAELVVVDYKTGRRVPGEADARDSLALGLYVLAVRANLRQPCTRVELHHVPSGGVAAWQHTEESLTRLRERAEHLARESAAARSAMRQARGTTAAETVARDRFPARTGPHCGWCEFRAHCAEGRAAAAETPSWGLLSTADAPDWTT